MRVDHNESGDSLIFEEIFEKIFGEPFTLLKRESFGKYVEFNENLIDRFNEFFFDNFFIEEDLKSLSPSRFSDLLDRIATNENRIATNENRIATNENRIATNENPEVYNNFIEKQVLKLKRIRTQQKLMVLKELIENKDFSGIKSLLAEGKELLIGSDFYISECRGVGVSLLIMAIHEKIPLNLIRLLINIHSIDQRRLIFDKASINRPMYISINDRVEWIAVSPLEWVIKTKRLEYAAIFIKTLMDPKNKLENPVVVKKKFLFEILPLVLEEKQFKLAQFMVKRADSIFPKFSSVSYNDELLDLMKLLRIAEVHKPEKAGDRRVPYKTVSKPLLDKLDQRLSSFPLKFSRVAFS